MAIEVKEFKPFYTRIEEGTLRIVFAYEYLSLTIDDETFDFIPVEDKEVRIDINTEKILNLCDSFVFRRGYRYKRISVHQLFLISGFSAQISKLFASVTSFSRNRQQNTKGVEPMKQIVKIIRKVDIERQYRQMLTLEQDYELASLSQAMKDNNNAEIIRSKQRLKEIHNELEDIAVYG